MTATKNRAARYVSPEETARLRRTVPDDPIELHAGYACEGCGIAAGGQVTTALPINDRWLAEFSRCADCTALHDIAGPGIEGRAALGTVYALAVIGIKPPADVTPLVPWLARIGSYLPWADPQAPSANLCNPYPWAHVRLSVRAQIKEAYLLGLRSRVQDAAPLAIAPPWGDACLFCGVGSIQMTPLDVVSLGGREDAAHAVWRRAFVQPAALDAEGPGLVDGFMCPPCTEHIDSVGAVGVTARASAFLAYVEEHRPEEASWVAALLDSHDSIHLPGWAALGTSRPNSEPWSHIAVALPEPTT